MSAVCRGSGQDFLPSTGRLALFECPHDAGVRVDAGVAEGAEVGVFYDPLLAKIITGGPDRATAIDRMRGALRRLRVGA
ncbi:MAG: hypothetical protein R3F60_26825 [bacterium]